MYVSTFRDILGRVSRRNRAAINARRVESGAQTDISALPNANGAPWRSESSLARKVRAGENFTTLPSKYQPPGTTYQIPIIVNRHDSSGGASGGGSAAGAGGNKGGGTGILRPSEKTSTEARRIMLSDISFTSMVPELSRSADHLCAAAATTTGSKGVMHTGVNAAAMQQGGRDMCTAGPQYGQYLRTGDYYSPNYNSSQRFLWSASSAAASPSDSHTHSPSRHSSTCHLSRRCSTPISPCAQLPRQRRHSSGVGYGSNGNGTSGATRASASAVCTCRSISGGDMMMSAAEPRSVRFASSRPTAPSRLLMMGRARSVAGGSMPELRSSFSGGDWSCCGTGGGGSESGGESTDSLVEEAEQFLRRSIDCMLMAGSDTSAVDADYFSGSGKSIGGGGSVSRRAPGIMRRASAPEPHRDNIPPTGWQPFLPRVPRDLHLDYWVKVIGPEGRVRGGRVRYVGALIDSNDVYVGVQLPTPDAHTDGMVNNRRYFQCEPDHGLFVPFKKVVMGWKP